MEIGKLKSRTCSLVPQARRGTLIQRIQRFLFDLKAGDPPSIIFGSMIGGSLPGDIDPKSAEETAFHAKVNGLNDTELIITAFRSDIPPHYSGPKRVPFMKIMMNKAKSLFLEGKRDAAYKLWKFILDINEKGEKHIVIYTMISLAKSLVRRNFSNLEAAIELWGKAHELCGNNATGDKVIFSITATANEIFERMLKQRIFNFKTPLKLWRTAYSMCSNDNQRRATVAAAIKYCDELVRRKKIDKAIDVWESIFIFTLDKNYLISVMMRRARSFSDCSLPPDHRDIESAVKIWEAVYKLNILPDDRTHLIRNMTSVAKLLSFIDFSKKDWDIDNAVRIWKAAYRLSQDNYIILSMEAVSKMLADPMPFNGERDVDSAIIIWQALFEMMSAEERPHLKLKIMHFANRLSSETSDQKDVSGSIKIWQLLCQAFPEEKMTIIKHMMKIANNHTDTTHDISLSNAETAIRIWEAAFQLDHSLGQSSRILKTMIFIANRLRDPSRANEANKGISDKILEAVERLKISLPK